MAQALRFNSYQPLRQKGKAAGIRHREGHVGRKAQQQVAFTVGPKTGEHDSNRSIG